MEAHPALIELYKNAAFALDESIKSKNAPEHGLKI